ncbi:sulfite exporter TauE/SafE family protein [Corynebacterium kefirresidentii]|uniref:sulfite exporter TauE/SafE family protein n=1 Tax=Corynebacterium kefirresidentii TaxID=1979527 RepID=UPI0026500093|nr:sulfite exporter TauE/SafE family protein [Corynebacterium kefirresidentii]MDN8633908.1 sulfite exporter TauE/SafE family protein [Corynebacterium kefirresidentii]
MSLALVIFLVVVVGSTLQRVSGMGLGLIGGPILMLIMGPVEGILVINVLACINAVLTTYSVRENVSWKKFGLIAPVMVIGSLAAALLIRRMDTAGLMVVVGLALLAALTVVTFGKKFVPAMEGKGPAISAGILGGFTNTLAGVAGPAITVYAQAAKWPQQVYAATLQPIFVVGGFFSVMTKTLTGAAHFDGLPWVMWPAGVMGMFVGIWAGTRIAQRVPREKARVLSLSVAGLGAASALVRGLVSLG